jgi:eukaryotic-like serine/threonine-protein kinase
MTTVPSTASHELVHELGRGGVGVVHLARRTSDGLTVVIKRLRPELARNVAVRRTFLEEARVASCVHHPNVVAVLRDGADEDGVPWIEMEWVPGVTLDAASDVAPLPLALFVQLIAELLDGLHAAHGAQGDDGQPLELVHRDVSPHNVLVGFDGHVRVLDFGIAKVRDSSIETTSGIVKGKSTYLAPEQAERSGVDARTDLFAVGIILWQRVAERRLWQGVSEPEIYHRLVSGQIPRLAEVSPDAPPLLCEVVQRALAPKRDDRYPSARAMREALVGAFPPPADATRAIAAHVKVAFAKELGALDRAAASVFPEGSETSAAAASSLREVPPAASGARRPARRVLALAAALAVAAGVSAFALRRATPPVAADVARAAAVTPTAPCTSDAACAAGEHCLESGACAVLEREGCRFVAPELDRATRPFLVGAMFPLTGPDADAYGRSNARAAELAVREINRFAGGVPTAGGRRPLALLLCDDAVDADARARHLAARVPAVTGFRSSDEALTLVRDVFVPARVLSVSALNASPLLAQLPAGDPRLFLRATASATAFADPLAQIVATMLVPAARRRAHLADHVQVKVAVVRSGNATGIAYADLVMRALERFAGVSAREIAAGSSEAAAAPAAARALDSLVHDPPHVVVALSDGLFASMIEPLERRSAAPEAARPLYVGATPWEEPGFAELIQAHPERRERFFAVSWPTSHRALEGFVSRYQESFGEVLIPSTASPGPYDAVYLVAYAAAAAASAAAEGPLDGPALARGVAHLLPGGAPLSVGPSDLVRGFAAVARGERVDLGGVITRLDFDPRTGDTAVDAVVLCTTFDPASKRVAAVDSPIAPGAPRCTPDVDTTPLAPR